MLVDSPWNRDGYCIHCDRDAHHSAACPWIAGLVRQAEESGDVIQRLQAKLQTATADQTRALMRGTVKGFEAGENADAKVWRQRAEDAEQRLHHEGIEHSECQQALIDAQARLTAKDVELQDARESFNAFAEGTRIAGERWKEELLKANEKVEEMREAATDHAAKVQMLVNVMDERGYLPEHVFTFPDGDMWEPKRT